MRYRPPVEGVKIQVSDATYQRLKQAAWASRCTVGQYAETTLCNYRKLGMHVPFPSNWQPDSSGRLRTFELSEGEYDEIDRFSGRKPRRWIAATILFALNIEDERQRGQQVEHEWREKHRI
jgi:hypothetical protein